jgi:hypothetical protein
MTTFPSSGPRSCGHCGGRIGRSGEVTGWVGQWCGCSALTPPDSDLRQEIARLKGRMAALESRTRGHGFITNGEVT